MDKLKTNFVIIIAVLAIAALILIGYAASLSAQLSAEKTIVSQLNGQIAGLNAKANDLQAELAGAVTKANDQMNLVNSLQASVNGLQGSLDTANAELEKLRTAYADLESKLKTEVPADVPQPALK